MSPLTHGDVTLLLLAAILALAMVTLASLIEPLWSRRTSRRGRGA